ncbi:single-stranded-DNA-specific exonuclease RecJ [Candidatus Parcubacteria bacterium]|uniref:Single-stranded-DNA-specific exonuclease RecJ n=1 Tax=Candidatus Kaiserbacteria bacterium CG10_big_fil_rev_8_21_14_0_10_47_16 TaxID=1974608 RepID=A0A2H0UDU8_9BACT|nr:single-stranded-DNA-specific exonuclease RecJ [Candidatus Parcubacteria bacterium]PIR84557.1 MAG: single-stranded-DNA-specific exonuclease RecJ [Candidatus Kaiserbacteria bacterium CG10_big_fil_rev_8_21_14_0_10_47_16]
MTTTTIYTPHGALTPEVEKNLEAYEPLLRRLLNNRGLRDALAAEQFLAPSYEEHLHDPFLFTDMAPAVERILTAIKNDEHIAIYSDYDCDGIPGGVLLHDFFKSIEFTNFENYIPHRHEEGYGFNVGAVTKLKENNVSLIITVDCGIVDHAAASKAKEVGIDVIITDHHEPSDTLPDALAVINPKRDDAYPFSGLCGSGVAFKLVQALIQKGKEQKIFELNEGQEKWLLDLVGIATIADMVPLVGENRALAHYGLAVLRKSRRPGLQQLLRTARMNQKFLTEDDIGFTIGPRINAASRMDDPEDAFHMLATRDEAEAGARVSHLEKLNNERRGVVAAMTKEAKKRMKLIEDIPNVIVVGNPDWRPSLVGLAANSLAETYNRPVFVWGRDGQGIIKGSCRSGGEVSVVDLMREAEGAFVEAGGHHGAGGFTVEEHAVHTLGEMLEAAYLRTIEAKEDTPNEIFFDTDVTLGDVNYALQKTLARLAPYGEGNAKPLFRFLDVVPSKVDIFGKTKEHTKMIFEREAGPLEAIMFFKKPEDFTVVPEAGKAHTLIAHIEESFFMGRKSTRLRIVDILESLGI